MLDIKYIRDNPDSVRANMQRKKRDTAVLEQALLVDKQYREILQQEQHLRAQRNKASEEVNRLKKEGADISQAVAQVKAIPEQIKALDEEKLKKQDLLHALLLQIPNMMHESVPQGESDADNVSLYTFGTIPSFDFPVRAHQEIADSLGMADFDSSANTSGNGFYYLQGDLALLNQALIRYAIERMVNEGFTYVETPLMLRSDVIGKVADLKDMEQQIYRIEQTDLALIGTSEHSLISRYIDQTLNPKDLPLKLTSYSMCFRKEKGSHGLDERGLFRTHQFNKVEMVVICHPDESQTYYEKMQQITVSLFNELGLPGRVLQMCTADLNDLKHISVDVEVWSPRRNAYIEVGSCSNLTQAQSLLLNIRANDGTNKFIPHTLNNTAIATSRALVAILENNQQKDGSVTIPTVLLPYMFGKKRLQ